MVHVAQQNKIKTKKGRKKRLQPKWFVTCTCSYCNSLDQQSKITLTAVSPPVVMNSIATCTSSISSSTVVSNTSGAPTSHQASTSSVLTAPLPLIGASSETPLSPTSSCSSDDPPLPESLLSNLGTYMFC